ncbi:hypothetical protein C3V36_11040 [Lachnospiraceae bacterium oral taxon 500]|nr:hypothetical protein C3V36_11040 [Lachnospiraceae bacterium oral taxon 500]
MEDDKKYLYDRLIRLGDMMGDGCHHEPDGKWIEREYRDTLKLLGLSPKKSVKRDTKSINKFMEKRLQDVRCECGGKLFQSRKGSFIATCSICGKRYKLGARKRG